MEAPSLQLKYIIFSRKDVHFSFLSLVNLQKCENKDLDVGVELVPVKR